MTTFKTGSLLVTSTGGSDTQPGILITFGSAASAGQGAIGTYDYANAPIFTVTKTSNGQSACYGDYMRAFPTGGAASNSAGAGFDGTVGPSPVMFPEGVGAAGLRMWAGTGAPSGSTVGGTATIGDIYIRRDRGTGTTVYRCTVGGAPGTWTASSTI